MKPKPSNSPKEDPFVKQLHPDPVLVADQSLPYPFRDVRTEHSGQFQRPIQKTEFFYNKLLQKMGVQFNDDN
jgi:hypothetical protein